MHKLFMKLAHTYLARRVRRRPPRLLSDLDLGGVRRVLIISNTALGDTLFSTPAIRALKERFPAWELEVLAHRVFGAILTHNPHVSRIFTYPGRNRRLLILARDLRRRGLRPGHHSPRQRPGSHPPGPSHGEPLYHRLGRKPPVVRLLRHRGAPATRLSTPSSGVSITCGSCRPIPRTSAWTSSSRRVKRTGPRPSCQSIFGGMPPLLMAFHPTGSDPYKWWPAASFVELGNFLYEKYQASLLIISGSGDRKQTEAIAAKLSGPTLVTGGRYPLLTVAALLTHCRLLVANDSGPLHLGLALKVPTIALIGADDPRRVGPYGVDWGVALHKRQEVCTEEPCRLKKCPKNVCLEAITVAEVVEMIKTWWEPQYQGSGARDQGPEKA